MQRNFELILSTLILLVVFYSIQDHVFFWDTIQLGAKHAWFFYESNFSSLILPEEIDSGHPPLLGILLAGVWNLFGKTLAVSHWLMFPFVWGIVWLLFELGDFFMGTKRSFLLVLLCMVDPVLAGQAILISPDLILVFGFLLGWYSILKKKPLLKVLAALLLATVSNRGMMVVLILFFVDVYEGWLADKPLSWAKLLRSVLHYVPSGLLAITFLSYHYFETGWIGYHPASTWAPSFERVDGQGLIKNVLVLGWRMLDFGRIFLWMMLLFILLKKWSKHRILTVDQKRVFFLFLISTSLLSITFLSYTGLQAHRYLLPVFISFNVFFIISIKNWILSVNSQTIVIGLGILALLLGNLWIYPDKISQGWDSTLAHWPYYDLREKMLDDLEKENIPLELVGTAFPEIGPLKFKDLSENENGLAEKDLEKQAYILYSNVMNDFTDEEIDDLKTNWKEIKRHENRGIKMIFYKK